MREKVSSYEAAAANQRLIVERLMTKHEADLQAAQRDIENQVSQVPVAMKPVLRAELMKAKTQCSADSGQAEHPFRSKVNTYSGRR